MPTTDATAQTICTRILRTIGFTGASEVPSSEDLSDVLDIVNGMLDSWTIDGIFIYNVSINVYALTATQQSYEIGTGAATPFDVARPAKIINANLVYTNQDPAVRIPLIILDDDGWMTIPVRGTQGTPVQLYYSPSYPLGVLNFWPIPSANFSVELETWTQLSQFTGINDQAVWSFPPGYFEAIYTNGALRCCTPEWGMNEVPPSIKKLAADSLSRIMALNQTPPPQMNPDYGTQGVRGQTGYRNLYNPAPIWTRQ